MALKFRVLETRLFSPPQIVGPAFASYAQAEAWARVHVPAPMFWRIIESKEPDAPPQPKPAPAPAPAPKPVRPWWRIF